MQQETMKTSSSIKSIRRLLPERRKYNRNQRK